MPVARLTIIWLMAAVFALSFASLAADRDPPRYPSAVGAVTQLR